ncbi:MAG TPA: alpha/beta-type small acid-soluble spore protein [Ruminiclostridium sp.]
MANKKAFETMKYEVANEVGVNLKQGYNGDLTSRDAGKIGGRITQKVFESYTGKK